MFKEQPMVGEHRELLEALHATVMSFNGRVNFEAVPPTLALLSGWFFACDPSLGLAEAQTAAEENVQRGFADQRDQQAQCSRQG